VTPVVAVGPPVASVTPSWVGGAVPAQVGLDLLSVPPWLGFLLAAVLVPLVSRRVGTGLAVALTALAVPWALLVPPGTALAVAPFGFEGTVVRVDPLSRAMVGLFGFVAAANVLYGHATGADARQTAYSLAYMGAGVAAVLAGDWLTLLVAWELLAVTATVLVWHHGGDAVRPAFRYAVYHLIGGTFLVAAVALQYAATGSFAFAETGGLATGLATTLAVLGVGVNLGFVGLHAWLPETYPTPHVAASVVLAGFTTKVAVYALVRVLPDGSLVVAWLGAAMVLYGVTQAILQTDMRRLLSYHIISQVGYMVVAIGVGTAAGLSGGIAHLTANVLYKGLLFMVAGAIIVHTGEASLKKLGGLARVMPVAFFAFLAAALAITGVPGFSGFVSKGLATKAVESALGGDSLLWWILVAGGVGTVLSFVKFGYYAFGRPAPDGGVDPDAVAPGSRTLSASLIAVAIPVVGLGLLPGVFLGAMPGDAGGFDAYAVSELEKAVATLVVGVVGFAVFRGPLGRIPSVDVDRLHPSAARLAAAASRTAAGAGNATARTAGRLTARIGAAAGRSPATPSPNLDRALLVLAATTALALVGALL
jgi:multicomponent Na+:H+ antiporter subunit D